MATNRLDVGTEIPLLLKEITQGKIDLFESCGIHQGENIHNNPEVAARNLGTTFPIASGRMAVAFIAEALRRFFGAEVFDHTGAISIKHIRPVKSGDIITVHGQVTEKTSKDRGTRVVVEVWCENQDGDKTTVGTGAALV